MSNLLALSKSRSISLDKINMLGELESDITLIDRINTSTNEGIGQLIELFCALSVLVIFSPVMLIVAGLIKIFMKGPIFYSQVRVGKDGKDFKIIKFRTMIENAEAQTGAVLASKNDPRITWLGRFLRASHVDELPQLINVLKGEMSFIGPRPERPQFVNEYNETIQEYAERHSVKPGITGLAQICLPYDATPQDKLKYDLFYIEHRQSFILNMAISYYTALKMVTFFKNS